MTPARAYEIASQWGSYMTSGDPGAIFYSFPFNDGRPQNEKHRAALIAYTDACIKVANERKSRRNDSVLERRELRELRAFFAAYPIVGALDEFTNAYITTALWSSNDNANDSGGQPLDSNYSITDIAPETMAKMIADCAAFQRDNTATMESAIATGEVVSGPDFGPMGRAGHDFWLTRCGHGAGFWDGDWPEPYASTLTDAAHAFREVDLYVGDDKLIHI